jgi:lysophospholipid acyltransferase (LPLAT)-like uncharacterized protein
LPILPAVTSANPLPLKRRFKQSGIRLLARILPLVYLAYMGLVVATSRVHRKDFDRLLSKSTDGEDTAVAVLHQDVFMAPFFFRHQGVMSLTSIGDAGSIATGLANTLGIVVKRGGSSSRASRRVPALTPLIDHGLERKGTGLMTVLTVDGSRGPAGACKAGIVRYAQAMGAEIYCVRVHARRAWHVGSWDRTAIPAPFNEIWVDVGDPLKLDAGANEDETEDCRRRVESILHGLHHRSFQRHGKSPVPALHALQSQTKESV